MDDKNIIKLFFDRAENAIDELSEKYERIFKRVSMNILNDARDAEECLNDTYFAVWNSIPPNEPDPLLGYVCKIVRNISLKKYRSNTAKKRNSFFDASLEELENCFASPKTVEAELEAKEISRLINEFLEHQSRENRILFVRRYFFCEPLSELAELFGISEHNISVRLARIREKLKKYLEKGGIVL